MHYQHPAPQTATDTPAQPAWMHTPAPANVQTAVPGAEGKGLMITGYILVGLTLLIPLLSLPALIVGIVTASVKKTQRAHGFAIIAGSILVGALAFALWASVNT